MLTVRQTIQALYEKRTKQENEELVSAVDVIAQHGLSGNEFFPELMQNIDDAIALIKQTQSTAVTIIFTQNYLIIRHAGKPFDAGDVTTLCKVQDKDSVKRITENVTGNKGIGFKSVYNVTQTVYIRSREDLFAFDKDHDFWAEKTALYPWALTPIPKEEADLPSEIRPYMPNSAVSFALKIDPAKRKEVLEIITQFLAIPENILFFRRISSITLTVKGQTDNTFRLSKKQVSEIKHDQLSMQTLQVDLNRDGERQSQRWLKYVATAPVPESVKSAIASNDMVIPMYKKAKSVSLQFAVEVKERTIIKSEKNKLFVTLPTEVQSDFNFHIHAEFLLDLPRLHLSKNGADWNRFILEALYDTQFQVLAHLATTEYWQSVPSMISKPATSSLAASFEMVAPLQQKFATHLATVPLIQNVTGNLITIKDRSLDPFEFLQEYGNAKSQANTANSAYLSQIALLKDLGAIEKNSKDFIRWLKSDEFHKKISSIANNKKFILFLIKVVLSTEKSQRKELIQKFHEIKLFLNERNALCSLKELFIPAMNFGNDQIYPFFNLLHSELVSDTHVISALREFGVRELTISHAISETNHLTAPQLIQFTNQLIAIQGSFSASDWIILAGLLVVNPQQQQKQVDQVYLTENHEPEFNLQTAFPVYPDLLHPDYDASPEGSAFFKKLPVQTTLTSNNIAHIIKAVNAEPTQCIPFTRALFTHYFLDPDCQFATSLIDGCKDLVCQTEDAQHLPARDCYLADEYEPKMRLQKYKLAVNFISKDYFEEADALDKWREFFIALGAKESIQITSIPKQAYLRPLDSICSKYFNYVFNGSNSEGVEYCPEACKKKSSYLSQQFVLNLYHIPFLPNIIYTHLFWEVVQSDWNSVTQTNSVYETFISKIPIPNALLYYIELACVHHHKKKPCDLYAPTIRAKLNDLATDLAFADVAANLTEEQQAFIGFRMKLTREDCYALLLKMQSQEMNASMLATLGFIYESLLQYEPHPELIPAGLKLFARDNSFKKKSSVFLLTDLDLQSVFTWKNLIRIPKSILEFDLSALAQHLGIQTIARGDLQCEPQNRVKNTELPNKLIERAIVLALLEATQNQNDVTQEGLLTFVKQWLMDFNAKLTLFKSNDVSSISLVYKDITIKSIQAWLDDNTLYFVPSKSSQAKMRLMQLLGHYFNISLETALLCDVFELDLDELQANHLILSPSNFTLIKTECVDLIPKITSVLSKRKTSPPLDSAETSTNSTSTTAKRTKKADEPVVVQDDDDNDTASEQEPQQRQWHTKYNPNRYKTIGWPGEQFVFELLKIEFRNKLSQDKYKGGKLTENKEKGTFTLSYGTRIKRLKWFNFKIENKNTKHYDIVQTTYENKVPIKRILIEVKATEHNSDEFEAFFSKEEVSLMSAWKRAEPSDIKQGYRLFCVFKPKDPNERSHIKFKDPLEDPKVKRVQFLINR